MTTQPPFPFTSHEASGLSYASTGDPRAPAVVLLHGAGTTSWMWRRLVADLRDQLHVVAVDLPGHGASARTPWLSMSDTATRVGLLSRHVCHGDSVNVVGLSLGGYVALDLAAQGSGGVLSVVASGVNVLPFPRPRLMRTAGRLMSPVMTTGVMLRANARALGVPAQEFDGYAEAARSMAPGTFLAVGGELMDYRIPVEARDSRSRVLALAGADEQGLIIRSLSKIAQAFPHGAARLVHGVGHAWNGQVPDLFAATVRAHISGCELPKDLVPVPA